MATINETVADVLTEFGKNIALMRKSRCVGVSLWNCTKYKLRIEAAHKREVESYKRLLMTSQCALNDEIVKNQNLKRELDSRAIIAGASMADGLVSTNAKLRECLKEAVDERCKKMCTPTALTTKNPILRNFCDKQCPFRKWRDTLGEAK